LYGTYTRGEVGVGLDIATAELDNLTELALLDNLVLLALLLGLASGSAGTGTGTGTSSSFLASTGSTGSSGSLLRLFRCRKGEHRKYLSRKEQAVGQLHGC
jgi:hypothetical protein